MLASSPASILNHIHAKKGIPFRFLEEQKDSRRITSGELLK